jgi:hypothetical protein
MVPQPATRPRQEYSRRPFSSLESRAVKLRMFSLLLAALGCAGCAALDALATGQTDELRRPPFVHRYEPFPIPVDVRVLAPVAFDRTTAREVLLPAQASAFEPLLVAMDARLAAMDCCRPGVPLADEGAPWVYVGSAAGETAPPEAAEFILPHHKFPPMVLHLDRPSAAWRARVEAQPPATAYLWIRLALVDYPRADEGFFGKKIVLGENHEVPQPFLRAELQPMQVLQVTGALLAPDGRVLAAGAEGIHAMDTPFSAQVFGLQKEIDPAAIRAIITGLRREDLPGAPLKWEAALDNLVFRLLHGV